MRIRDGKNSDPGSEMEKIRIRASGSGINIPDSQHCLKGQGHGIEFKLFDKNK